MVAGLRQRAKIWRINFDPDDAVGGAMPTGTCSYSSVYCRVDSKMPSQLLLQQGLETQETFTAIVVPVTLSIFERDEFELVHPYNHYLYGKRLRIVGVTPIGEPFDPKSYIVLSMTRSDRAHNEQ